MTTQQPEGILLVNKPKGKTSFSLIQALRKILNVRKIGHAGTLDPLATGVVVLMVGSRYTRLSNQFLNKDKEYEATLTLGITTDSYDAEGKVLTTSPIIPTLDQLKNSLKAFQGTFPQTPPMFSAKKIGGKKLYELARRGIEIERKEVLVSCETLLLDYHYPKIHLRIKCSKGTYIRSIAHDLGAILTCGAHLSDLKRLQSGHFSLAECFDGNLFFNANREEVKPQICQALIQL